MFGLHVSNNPPKSEDPLSWFLGTTFLFPFLRWVWRTGNASSVDYVDVLYGSHHD